MVESTGAGRPPAVHPDHGTTADDTQPGTQPDEQPDEQPGPRPPDLVQLLTPDGERVPHPDHDLDLSPDELRALHRDLVLVRRVDTEATHLQRQGELGLWASLLGQEAAQVGSGRALTESDMAFPTYREHGVAWCRGVDPVSLLALFRGVDHGGWDPAEHRFGLYSIVIGSQTLHAVGYAMGMQRDGGDGAVVAYFGDGATSQGDVNEAFVWASVTDAPVVFFCQNNQWAISEPSERQTRVPLYRRADGFGFPGVRVDGNDVLACLAVTRWALARAREGAGPVLVEAFTYRMGAHTTSDDPRRYREEAERLAWEARDPIARVEAYLRREGLADDGHLASVQAEADALAARVRAGCLALEDPGPEAIFDRVYAGPHAKVDAQREDYATYLRGFAPEGAAAGPAGAGATASASAAVAS